MMTEPAISRPKKSGTNIGGTSHPRRSNFWLLDILTAVPFGGSPELSVTGSSQMWTVMDSPDALSVMM
jgi:hypothetical protein